nr:unnamed protein product [Callosobruchus analis]
MQFHQIFTQTPGMLKYHNLSCFCNRGFCSCQSPKINKPIPDDNLEDSDEDYFLTMSGLQKQSFYNLVYSSDSEDEQPLSSLKKKMRTNSTKYLNNKESPHPNNISEGVYVLVELSGGKNKYYTYLGMALSSVEEDGDVKTIFFKSLDDSGKLFRLVSGDISYEPYENIVKIIIEPTKKVIGKRELYEFNNYLDIFEK